MKIIFFPFVCYLMKVSLCIGLTRGSKHQTAAYLGTQLPFLQTQHANLSETETLLPSGSLVPLIFSYSNKAKPWTSCKPVYKNAIL